MTDTWQPIVTAPKDGTEFVAAYANQGFVKLLVSFNPFYNIWVSKGEWVPGFEANATHWISLPPKEAKSHVANTYSNAVLIETQTEGGTEWGVSFNGSNPESKDYVACSSYADAARLIDRLAPNDLLTDAETLRLGNLLTSWQNDVCRVLELPDKPFSWQEILGHLERAVKTANADKRDAERYRYAAPFWYPSKDVADAEIDAAMKT